MQINRRGLLLGLASVMAAPAIVRASNLMPIKPLMEKHWIIHGMNANGIRLTELVETYPYRNFTFGEPLWDSRHSVGKMVWYLGKANDKGLRLTNPDRWKYINSITIGDGISLRSMAHP